jgi:hypothetical protein
MPRTSSMPMAYSRSSPIEPTVAPARVRQTYPGCMNTRARRLIVSGVLGGLLLVVVVVALWNRLQ